MRKVVVTEYITLDGVVEDPAWTGPYWNDEIADFKFKELFSSDVLLLGRKTYEGFAQAWPSVTDEQGFADRMNSMPKYVASNTLDNLEWNAQLFGDDITAEVARLKQGEGQNLLVYGSADFTQTLMENDLVDEYWLLVYPVVLGSGKRFFKEGVQNNLQLVDSKTFSSGVIALKYIPDRK